MTPSSLGCNSRNTRVETAVTPVTPVTALDNTPVSPIGDAPTKRTNRGRGRDGARPHVDTPLGPRRASYVDQHRMYTKSEARKATDDVKREASQLWKRLGELHRHQVHRVLGYASWELYCLAEFNVSKSHAYRMIRAAEVEDGLVTVSGVTLAGEKFSEAQLRELGQSDKPHEVWENATKKYGDRPTAAQLKCEVQGIEWKPKPSKAAHKPADAKRDDQYGRLWVALRKRCEESGIEYPFTPEDEQAVEDDLRGALNQPPTEGERHARGPLV
jgi:hypothetical protein